jgi:hypothetical protein
MESGAIVAVGVVAVLVVGELSVVAGDAGSGSDWVVSGVLVIDGAVTGSGPETRARPSLPLHAASIAMLATAIKASVRVM